MPVIARKPSSSLLFAVPLAVFLAEPASAGVVMTMKQHLQTHTGERRHTATMYVVPLASRFDIEMPAGAYDAPAERTTPGGSPRRSREAERRGKRRRPRRIAPESATYIEMVEEEPPPEEYDEYEEADAAAEAYGHDEQVVDDGSAARHRTVSYIVRLDKKVVWFVLPGTGHYYEMSFEKLLDYQDDGTFNWRNDNPFRTGADVGYVRLTAGRRILGHPTRKYRMEHASLSGECTVWVREKPRSRVLDKFAANQRKLLAEYGVEGGWDDPPGVVLASRTYLQNGDKLYWEATSFRTVSLEAGTFDPPEGAQRVAFDPNIAAKWMLGVEDFKHAFKQAVGREVKRQAKEAVKREGKKAIKKGVKGLFKRW